MKPVMFGPGGDELVGGEEEVVSPDFISEEDAADEVRFLVDDSLSFMDELYATNWENAQKYFDGKSAIPIVEGQSRAVATVVRDMIRAAKPSIMRVLTTSSSIVEFRPSSRETSELAKKQTLFVNSEFYRAGGYELLLTAVQNACLKRIAPLTWWYEPPGTVEYMELTGVVIDQLEALKASGSVVLSEELHYEQSTDVMSGQPVSIPVADVILGVRRNEGRLRVAALPLVGFFYHRNASCLDDSAIVGFQRNERISDVMKYGIEYKDLEDLDSSDPELNLATGGESVARRGLSKTGVEDTKDPIAREVLITHCYVRFDLLGVGDVQLWHFILGGTDKRLLKRKLVSEIPICIARIDPVPHTPTGLSFADILIEDQNVQTSVLRGTINNLHQANNRRLAYHDTMVNGRDVNNTAIGAHIRVRAPGMIQEIGTTPIINSALPFLDHLRTRSENKIGVTAAAAGLDPDAMQSTDKEAVLNTIKLSMGQLELMTRNFAESLVPMFRGLLKLSLRHFPSNRTMDVKGIPVPVNTATFNPDLYMEAAVGLGTNNVEERRIVLEKVMSRQDAYIKELSPSNPFCDFSHVAAAQEDLLEAYGVYNPDRYFKNVPTELGAQIAQEAAQQQQMQAQKDEQTPPEHVVLMQVESIRAEAAATQSRIKATSEQRIASLETQLAALKASLDDDFRRDELAQARAIAFAELEIKKASVASREEALVNEQKAPRDKGGNVK